MNETIIKDFVKAIKAENKRPSAYDTTATVTRIDGDTAWVHIPGGVDETPVKRTIDAKKGDTVQVRVSGGTAYLIGNASAPPTDDTKANVADAKAVSAKKTADKADSTATAAKNAVDRVAQYFWTDEEGAHVTVVPKDAFLEDPENGEGNTLIDADGMSVRDALKVLAMFRREQARIGAEDGGNIVFVPTGLNINNAGVQFATFDIEDGIMFKTQQGADALSVVGDGEIITSTIKDVVSIKEKILSVGEAISSGTKTSETVIGSAYPTDTTLIVSTTPIYQSGSIYPYYNSEITYSEDEDTIVLISSYRDISSNITIDAYLVWLTTGELVLRIQKTNPSASPVYLNRDLVIDVSYVSYTNNVYIPKISTDGHLYLYGHSTPVGDLMEASTSNYSNTYSSGSTSFVYPAGDGTYSSRVKLPAGRWVITATIRIETLTSGAQYGVGIGYGTSKTSGISLIMSSRNIVTAGSTSALVLNTTHLADASGDNYYSVGLYHGGKATITDIWLRAMRIR